MKHCDPSGPQSLQGIRVMCEGGRQLLSSVRWIGGTAGSWAIVEECPFKFWIWVWNVEDGTINVNTSKLRHPTI